MTADAEQPISDSRRHALESVRGRVTRLLMRAVTSFPLVPPMPARYPGLDPRDTRLAVAIHRTVLQRWLTLEHILAGDVRQPFRNLEPALRSVLLAGAAQLLFMQRLPAHAVVDESVELARELVRPGAAALVNAVLRRTAQLVKAVEPDTPWTPAQNCIPLDRGRIVLREDRLPPVSSVAEHLAVATSVPRYLIDHWINRYDADDAAAIALQAVETPPTIVAVEPHFDRTITPEGAARVPWRPHEDEGFVVWVGTHEELVHFLAQHSGRRVQDPTSAAAVAATASLRPCIVLDFCAGRGTKTRQLAWLHPASRVIATDVHAGRLADLKASLPHDRHIDLGDVKDLPRLLRDARVDLLVLDVPCTNTGVLARRPEARYRAGDDSTRSLITLQRDIATMALKWLRPGGHVLYSTCSLEPVENDHQVAWLVDQFHLGVIGEAATLPEGHGASYRDGGYYALLKSNG